MSNNYVKETIGEFKDGPRREQVVRVYHKDHLLLNREQVDNATKSILSKLKPNQTLMVKAMTEYNYRTMMNMGEEQINWKEDEEYLKGSKNPHAKPLKEVYFIDFYIMTNY